METGWRDVDSSQGKMAGTRSYPGRGADCPWSPESPEEGQLC